MIALQLIRERDSTVIEGRYFATVWSGSTSIYSAKFFAASERTSKLSKTSKTCKLCAPPQLSGILKVRLHRSVSHFSVKQSLAYAFHFTGLFFLSTHLYFFQPLLLERPVFVNGDDHLVRNGSRNGNGWSVETRGRHETALFPFSRARFPFLRPSSS